ncbi:MAG: M48 family metallopeptidase [Burkholderiaceae bacterium]|jgi:STE24 endopeptidase|nr:M48 family metallopeptidase [Burkholderiaceae bacterium]
MTPPVFTGLFLFFLVSSLVARVWLSLRHVRHVGRHRDTVPARFADAVSLSAHQKAADYTLTKTRFSLAVLAFNTLVLLGFTLFGGLDFLSVQIHAAMGGGMVYQMVLVLAFCLISGLLDAPWDYYRQFVIEERFGFNKMTRRLFVTDKLKGMLLGLLLVPLLWVTLLLMLHARAGWWFYAWLVWNAFQLLLLVLYPTWIAPLFNRFSPLQDPALAARIKQLLERTGFTAKGLFVMDGSRRSAHGNAYFTGFGSAKRIVFFDTLIDRLKPEEVEAVLAHELGHFRLRHIIKRMTVMALLSLGFLALLGYLKEQTWFYLGLGVTPLADSDAQALLLFSLVLPVFSFFFSPLASLIARRHEFEADAFAAQYASADDLVSALVRMYEDNAATLTPDPLRSAFYDSHPPAATRIARLLGSA